MINLFELAQRLSRNRVEFVIVGGIAIRSHGGNYITEDLDICYYRSRENVKRLAGVLAPLNPRPRGRDIDLLGEVAGIGSYTDLLKGSITVDLDGFPTQILSIPGLIVAKQAAARPKDEAGLKVLQALREAELKEEE